jgi:hypothetical protein
MARWWSQGGLNVAASSMPTSPSPCPKHLKDVSLFSDKCGYDLSAHLAAKMTYHKHKLNDHRFVVLAAYEGEWHAQLVESSGHSSDADSEGVLSSIVSEF